MSRTGWEPWCRLRDDDEEVVAAINEVLALSCGWRQRILRLICWPVHPLPNGVLSVLLLNRPACLPPSSPPSLSHVCTCVRMVGYEI